MMAVPHTKPQLLSACGWLMWYLEEKVKLEQEIADLNLRFAELANVSTDLSSSSGTKGVTEKRSPTEVTTESGNTEEEVQVQYVQVRACILCDKVSCSKIDWRSQGQPRICSDCWNGMLNTPDGEKRSEDFQSRLQKIRNAVPRITREPWLQQ